MKKPSLDRFYDDYWASRDGWTPHPSLSPIKRQLLTRLITNQSVVLDVGCGDGTHYGKTFASVATTYYGLEVSSIAAEIAQRNGIQAQIHDLASPFPFRDAIFDNVICIEVLEHLFDPACVLNEIHRVLKPDGYVLLSVPNIVHISNRVRMLLGAFSPGGTPETSSRRQWADPHIRFFTLRSLRRFVVEHDLHIAHLYGESFSLFNTFPFASPIAAKFFGWERLEEWSKRFEFLAHFWPSLCAANLIAVLTKSTSRGGGL